MATASSLSGYPSESLLMDSTTVPNPTSSIDLPSPLDFILETMLSSQSAVYVAIWICTLLALAAGLTYTRSKSTGKAGSAVLQWFERKRYQYEVTFSLYMLTPTEKFIFNSTLFLCLSLLIIATVLYGPEHVFTMWHRATYYLQGEQLSAALQPNSSDFKSSS